MNCATCNEPYSQPPSPTAAVCSNSFHCCRDCVWVDGARAECCEIHQELNFFQKLMISLIRLPLLPVRLTHKSINKNIKDHYKTWQKALEYERDTTALLTVILLSYLWFPAIMVSHIFSFLGELTVNLIFRAGKHLRKFFFGSVKL